MRPVDAAKLSLSLLADHRSLVVLAGFVTAGASAVQLAESVPVGGLLAGPAVGAVYLFVEPFLAGGLLGAVDEALDSRRAADPAGRGEHVGTDTFVERGREHYADLLAARLVVVPALVVYVLGTWGAGTTLRAVLVYAFDGSSQRSLLDALPSTSDPAVLAVAAVAGLALVLAAVAVVVLQFYPAAIVVGGAGPLESFRYSYDLVRDAPAAAVGYTAVTTAAGLPLVVGPLVVAAAAQRVAGEALTAGTAEPMTAGLLTPVVGTLAMLAAFVPLKLVTVAFVRTYHVAFVRTTLGTA